jgi:bacterial/archaeal transporter family-2 protein
MNPLWLIVPILIGLAQPVIMQMSVRVSRVTGEMESAVILHAVGAIIGLLWMGLGIRGVGFSVMNAVPWWAYLAGAIGVTCLAAVNWTLPIVGVATFCALAVASQLIIALLFDRYGLMGAEVRQVGLSHWCGVALLVSGAFLVSR